MSKQGFLVLIFVSILWTLWHGSTMWESSIWHTHSPFNDSLRSCIFQVYVMHQARDCWWSQEAQCITRGSVCTTWCSILSVSHVPSQKDEILETIQMVDDAKLIFYIVKNECHHCEEGLMSALTNAEEACCHVCDAEEQMELVDMCVERAWYIIKKSGFGTILQPTGQKTQPLVLEIWGAFFFSWWLALLNISL